MTCERTPDNQSQRMHEEEEEETDESAAIYENVSTLDKEPKTIPVGKFLEYVAVKNADPLHGFQKDFKSLPAKKPHSQDVATKEENKEKNRFKNILPYDNFRVKLSVLKDDPNSDYINASFIDGFKACNKYIASQGPNTASVNDFWRMVWQFDCRKIVMLTNTVEANKKKCEKYWPENSDNYGDVYVTQTNSTPTDHYVIRYFNLVCNNTGRDIIQFHYTAWPDMGVPECSAHLMNYVRTTRESLKFDRKSPIIVHCSAGVGRTGTFLTLDAMLDQIKRDQTLDVHSFILNMRQRRPNMVQTEKQYRFIYEALAQDLTCGVTSIPRCSFGERHKSLLAKSRGTTDMQKQYELLEALTVSLKDEETAAARTEVNAKKNRYPERVPGGRTRPFLITNVEGGNNYINASFLPGHVSKNQYIGTQTPMPNTLVDFWRLIVDYRVETIVMLHGNSMREKIYAEYWPAEGTSMRYGPFTVKLITDKYNRPIRHRTLEVTKTGDKNTIHQFQLASHPPNFKAPPAPGDVLNLYKELTSTKGSVPWKDGEPPLLIHCRDGEGLTGAFCAFLAVMDQLEGKDTVDIFLACKRLRTSRPGVVSCLAEYKLIYETIKCYLDSTSIYENIAKIV